MSTSVQVLAVLLAILGYLGAPITLIWGWARWAVLPKSRTVPSMLSLLGFILASASALLAISTLAYAFGHRFAYYDPQLLKIMRAGVLLSLGGLVFGLSGVWKANALRWHAPVSAAATFAFWFLMASME